MDAIINENNLSSICDEELQAEDLLKCGQVDEANLIYEKLSSNSARILHLVGTIHAEKKNDYQSAIEYYTQALSLQQETGEDTSSLLTATGFAYQNLRQYDLALLYHSRAFSLRNSTDNINKVLVAKNLIGIANAYWGEQKLSEALKYAYQALALNISVQSGNDENIALNFATLANIYHDSGDDDQALKLIKRAVNILESVAPSDSPSLASFLNNLGVIELSLQQYTNAKLTFIRVLHIYDKTLPKQHPKRVTLENYVRGINTIEQPVAMNTSSYFYEVLSKVLLLY